MEIIAQPKLNVEIPRLLKTLDGMEPSRPQALAQAWEDASIGTFRVEK
jgi:hypothetical protein